MRREETDKRKKLCLKRVLKNTEVGSTSSEWQKQQSLI